MGLRYRRLLLHDGREGRVLDAILAHGGEAEGPRNAFAALDRLTQEKVLRFLGTLGADNVCRLLGAREGRRVQRSGAAALQMLRL
jgi:hypothetical protein